MTELKAVLSLTEVPQFRRLVELLQEVESYAQEMGDAELLDMVECCREDLEQCSQ